MPRAVLFFSVLALLSLYVDAATFRVTTADDVIAADGLCSLREAVRAANNFASSECGSASSGPDVIVLDPAVTPTIFLTNDGGAGENAAANGDLDVTEPLTITSEVGSTVIDALQLFNVFEVFGGSLTLNAIEIRNGYSSDAGVGGGITSHGASITLNECVMRHNLAEVDGTGLSGGAIASDGGSVLVSDSTFHSNVAVADFGLWGCGGAIAVANASVVASNSVFEYNRGEDRTPHGGASCSGAISVVSDAGSVNVNDCSFVRNSGVRGGAIGATNVIVTVDDTELIENESELDGGAIASYRNILIDGGATIPTIVGNRAGGNGGVAASTQGSVIFDTVDRLERNSAVGDGGVAFAYQDASINVVSHDIISNGVYGSGGVLCAQFGEAAISYIGGSIQDNYAGVAGGVTFSQESASILHVNGNVARNRGQLGGVVYVADSTRDTTLQDIGSIYGNNAAAGGVVYVSGSAGSLNIDEILGDISENSAIGDSGGVALVESMEVSITNVGGSIVRNFASEYGGVVASFSNNDPITISNVQGDLSQNVAATGGVVYLGPTIVRTTTEISYIGGSISSNFARDFGGVVFSTSDVEILDVTGSISGNLLTDVGREYVYSVLNGNGYTSLAPIPAQGSGGVVMAFGDVTMKNVGGDISDNSAGAFGFGGVILSYGAVELSGVGGGLLRNVGVGSVVYGAEVEAVDVGGSVSYNSSPVIAAFAGAATLSQVGGSIVGNLCDNAAQVYANPAAQYAYNRVPRSGVIFGLYVELSYVQGEIAYNGCSLGGVAGALDRVIIQSTGDIHHNVATVGGVGYSFGAQVEIRYVGDIAHNSSDESGGVIAAGTTASIVSVGRIEFNTAGGYGGVIAAAYSVLVSDTGAVEHNTALFGGVVAVDFGNVGIQRIGGDIAFNRADGMGGVLYQRRGEELVLNDVTGNIRYNTAGAGGVLMWDEVYRVTVSNVTGDVSYNTASSTSGGVMNGYAGDVSISYIGGSVSHNVADGYGGVVYNVNGTVLFDQVGGSFNYNQAIGGGVVYAGSRVDFEDIDGSFIGNSANTSGGVSRSGSSTEFRRIGGGFFFNTAGGRGGVADATTARMDDIGDAIGFNTAADDGGVLYATSVAAIYNVNGGLYNNFAGVGGGVISADGAVYIENIAGDVAQNTSGEFGGVAYSQDTMSVTSIFGAIRGNSSAVGGAFASFNASHVVGVYGNVAYNTARHSGGLFFADGSLLIQDVYGYVSYNSAEVDGGVAYGYTAVLDSVHGDIEGNSAGRAGGVLFGYSAETRVSNVTGSILNNSVFYNLPSALNGGGVVFGYYSATVRDIGGSIEGNTALSGYGSSGGVARTVVASVDITRVGGAIAYNRCSGGGGVAYAPQNIVISDIDGSVSYNSAGSIGGGVAFTEDSAVFLYDIAGDVNGNRADGNGGVARSWSYGYVGNVSGTMNDNASALSGGVLYVENGDGIVRDVDGEILRNRAGEYAGVLYANAECVLGTSFITTVDLRNVGGRVSYNSSGFGGGVIATRGCYSNVSVYNIGGDISYNEVVSPLSINPEGGVIFQDGIFGEVLVADIHGGILHNTVSGSLDSYGGAFSSHGTSFLLRNIHGDVRGNRAAFGGALFVEHGDVTVESIFGDIAYNTAEDTGGFLDLNDGSHVTVRDVTGGLIKNVARSRHGGFVYQSGSTGGSVIVESIGGPAVYNTADEYGGFVYARSSVLLSDFADALSFNGSTDGAGGVVFSESGVTIERVASITNNFALNSGAVVQAAGGIVIDSISGEMSYNSVLTDVNLYGGGALFTPNDILVERVGGLNYNTGGWAGGVAYGNIVSIRNVFGSICGNTATIGGAAAAVNGLSVRDVSGDICSNSSVFGGGAFYGDDVVVSNVSGNIEGNSSSLESGDGGFAYSQSSLVITNVNGRIAQSSARNGGVGYSSGDIELSNIGDGVVDCSAADNGGVFFGNTVLMTAIGGNIEHHTAGRYGGVAFCVGEEDEEHNIVIDGVIGSIVDSHAVSGGVAYTDSVGTKKRSAQGATAFSSITIRNVSGDIARNLAIGGYGGVASTNADRLGPVLIENVGGNVTENEADYGGVVFTNAPDEGDVVIRNVDGDISFNKAIYGSGGVVYSGDDVELADIGGRICSNTAAIDGGVAVSRTGSGLVVNVGDGPIVDNVAGEYGGVLWALNDALVDAGNGIILGNVPDVVYSQNSGVESVSASLVISGSLPTLDIIQQPSDGTEFTPLPIQPEVIVSGAIPAHELPLREVLILEDGTEIVLEEQFNVLFGATAQYQDLAIPLFGQNMHLRIELVVLRCGDVEPTVLASDTTVGFNVSECLSPAPVLCPSDIVVPAKQHECSAFVSVPAPVSSRCSSATVTHNHSPSLVSGVAVGEYAVGSTVVTYTVRNEAGASDTCQMEVTVVDTQAPQITCPVNVVASSDPGQCGATVTLEEPVVFDNCGASQVSVASSHASFFPVGTTVVTYTATDADDNVATCTVSVTVVDVEPPVITCPNDVTVGCDALPDFSSPTGTDNCPGAVTVQRGGPVIGATTPLPPGISVFEFEVVDAQGERDTCRFRVTTESDWYLDADGDGVGQRSAAPIVQCPAPGPNYVQRSGDCDDTNPNLQVLLYPDADLDGFGNSQLPVCSPASASKRGEIEEVPLIPTGGDCNDADPLVNPNQIELCNGIDDNCNGQVDEGCAAPQSPPSAPTISLQPAAPLAPEASLGTIIILPTPLPRSPPSPDQQLIIIQPAIQSDSAGSVLSVLFLSVIGATLLALLW